jgi:uncharacterized protein (TIGR02118 family)
VSNAKLVVLYPEPTDRNEFDRVYAEEHVPLMEKKLAGLKVAVTKILGAPGGPAPYYCIAEVYGPSLEAIQEFLGTPGGQEVAAHAGKISSGGAPTVMLADENVIQL